MDDNVKQRLETVKNILRSISLNYPDEIDFMLVSIDLKNNDFMDYLFSVKKITSPQGFHMISEISNQDFLTQQRYRYEAETNKSQIVYCIDPDFIQLGVTPLIKNKLYKVLEVSNIEGQIYYELEYLQNDKNFNFKGYEAKRFIRILSSNSVN